MKTRRHSTVKRDFLFLETIAEWDDQIIWADEVNKLIANPTKKLAAEMYESGIRGWFREHGVSDETKHIARKYGITE